MVPMLYSMFLSLLVVSLPAMAHAQIYSHTSASSNTGGNVVGPGGKVITGNESASVRVSNTSAQGTSSSSVYIKTEVNGTVHEETVATRGAMSVSVEATPAKTTIKVQEGTPPITVRSYVAGPVPEGPGLGARIILAIQSIFLGLLGWFR